MLQRLFVGNLPQGVTADELKQEFGVYGLVENVDLKIKENLVDSSNPNVFAFITIDINKQMIQQCINEFNEEQYRGRYLEVSVARESFLDRLKREREEAGVKVLNEFEYKLSGEAKEVSSKITTLPQIERKSSVSSSSDLAADTSDSSESQEDQRQKVITSEKKTQINGKVKVESLNNEEINFITKKRASTSLQNGKIIIEHMMHEPIHVINKKTKNVRELDEKAKISDLKRKESLNKMTNQYNQQKMAIQKALSSIDKGKSNKVIFNDDNDDDYPNQKKRKINLFDEDYDNKEDNYENDFKVRKEYEGKDGEKLMKLQSKFKLDPRFKMNEKFLDNKETEHEKSSMENNEDNEQSWQLGIIEKVIGHKLESPRESQKKKMQTTMVRFDPTKEEHKKYLKNVEVTEPMDAGKKTETTVKETFEVSKEQFYVISDDLKKSFGQKGDGFSLLSMFNKMHAQEETDDCYASMEIVPQPKSLQIKKKNDHIDNPFEFDSSDSECENLKPTLTEPVKDDFKKPILDGKTSKVGVWNETFFIFINDKRLKDGLEFFKQNKINGGDESGADEDYDKVRDKLRIIINKKIAKSKKNMKNRNPKQKKFKRK